VADRIYQVPESLCQQVVEALCPLANAHFPSEREALTDEDSRAAQRAISALLALQVAAPGEPDAWIAQNGNTFDVSVKRPTEMGGYAQLDWQPLYRATPLHREPASKVDNFLAMVRVWVERDGGDMDAALAWMYREPASSAEPWWKDPRNYGLAEHADLTRSPSAPAGEPTDTQRLAECHCARCNPGEVRMFICPQCGCKRCPQASNHEAPCSGKTGHEVPGGHTCTGCEEVAAMWDEQERAALSAGSQKQDGGQG
jgi:hypothetical protein